MVQEILKHGEIKKGEKIMKRLSKGMWLSIFLVFSVLLRAKAYANVAEIDVTLTPLSFRYYALVIEQNEVAVTVDIVRGSGDIDLYVKRGTPAVGRTSDDIYNQADFASASSSWHESVTISQNSIPPISPGTWYVTLVNLNDYTVQVRVRATSQIGGSNPPSNSSSSGSGTGPASAASNPAFRPQSGLWYNKAKPGHGVDIEVSGNNLAAVWYTYNQDQTPAWYLAIGPYSGSKTWSATLNKYHWNGSSATPTPVGNITLDFKNRTQATFRWTLNGQRGSEPIERFRMADKVPQSNLTGLWYNNAEPGYGYSIDTQGSTLAIVAYFYDSQGEPRWALNSSTGQNFFSKANVPALIFFGPCPNCSNSNFRSVSAGTITRNFTDPTNGIIGANINLPAPMNSTWNKPEATVVLLSTQVNNKELELEMAVDDILSILTDSSDIMGGLGSLNLSNIKNSTCPKISYGDLHNFTLSGPMYIPLQIDFGSGCTDKAGNRWSGHINAPLNVTLGNNLHLDTQLTVDGLMRNGQFLGNGSASIVLDLVKSGSSGLASGIGRVNLNMQAVEHKPLQGQIDLKFTNIKTSALFSLTKFNGSYITGLVQTLGNNGVIDITLNNLMVGQDTNSGTISLQGLSQGSSRVDLNLQTSSGPVIGSFFIKQGSSQSDFFINTTSPITVADYQVVMENLEINRDKCENTPVSGSIVVTKGANRGRFTFDGSCLGYVFTSL